MQNRLPPGQKLIDAPDNFPILDLGVRPAVDLNSFTLQINGAVERPAILSWPEILTLPSQEITADFHCVTKWSKFDIKWTGVAWQEIEKLVLPLPNATAVMQHGLDGYTTNNLLTELRKPSVTMVYKLGEELIPSAHGGPVRLLIPHLYAWKGSKFLHRIEFLTADSPGFWENRGYHMHADPWQEERYS